MTNKKEYLLPTTLMALTALTGLVLSAPSASADTSGTVTLTVDVPASCSLTVTPGQHSVTIEHNHTGTIGTSTIKSVCNDPAGFAIYAVGNTNDNYGDNRLTATVGNDSYYIASNASSGTPASSEWNMTLSPVSGDYAPEIVTGFTTPHAIPTTYTKVAYRNTMTDMGDNAIGANFTATYNAYIDGSQAAGSYTGKVKYLLIHPSDSPNPVSLLYYNANGGTNAPASQTGTPGTNPGTYDFTLSSTIPKKYESIFLGWSEDPEATEPTYQPEEAINTGKPLTLYAVWRQADVTLLDTGQTVNRKLKRLAGNSSASYTSQDTAITAIQKSNSLPSGFEPTDGNTISTSSSTIPVYAWFDNGTIYYHSEADIIYLNSTSSHMFTQMRSLSDGSGLASLDASKTTNMYQMFYYAGYSASTFSLDLSGWDTSEVTNMSSMFSLAGYSATTFSLNLSGWDTSSVTSMNYMFQSAGYSATTWSIGDLSDWDTSKVTGMSSMFSSAGYSATTWSIGDLSGWDTSKVTSMSQMFNQAGYNATTFSLNLSDWTTSSVTDMSSMFSSAGYSATTFSLGDLSDWNTSEVTTMSSMFYTAGRSATTWSIGDLSGWDTSKVTNMGNMFSSAGRSATTWSIGDLSDWATSSVTNISYMFQYAGYSATAFSLDLSGWDTSKVTSMSQMFNQAGYNATAFSLGDLSDWDTSSVTNMSGMFYLAGLSATTWSIGDLSGWDTSKVTNMSYMFDYAGNSATTFSLDLSGWDTSSVTNMSYMFYFAGRSATTWSIGELSGWDTSKVTDMSQMFYYAGLSATTFSLNLSGWDTSSVTSMNSMFSSAGSRATTWSVIIPQTNGGGISNATNRLYGQTTSVYGEPPSGKSFTLAP